MSSSVATKLHPLSTTATSSTRSRPNSHPATPSARALSPTSRLYPALTAPRGMPSPRTSPAMRPTSPLSPGFKTTGYFDTFQAPTQRPMQSRTNSNQPHHHHHHHHHHQRRAPTSSLRLPSLPRFHPANFPSGQNSQLSTPDTSSHGTSPQPPMSPRQYQRLYNDAQKQLYFNQRELFSTGVGGRPTSPRLQPLGSPGPVTPLELEGEEGYLIAGARSMNTSAATPSDVVESMVKAEVQQQRKFSESGSLRQSSR